MISSKVHSRAQMFLRRLQLAALASGVVLSPAALAQTASNQAPDSGSDALEEVVVTGTLIRGAQPTGAELVTLDRKQIEATGAASTTNLMTNLPQLASFNALPIGTSDFANPVPRFNIRNSGGTLVLVNGHRMVGEGVLQTTPDPSAIPVSAIQRVEVLPDGASATYGADAVGGVVNFILRTDYNGAETRASYGHGDSYNEYDLAQLFGKAWGSGNILVSFEYTQHNNFSFGSRNFYNNDVSAVPGGRNHFVNNCPSPNITIAGVSYAAPGYLPNTKNACDPNRAADVLPYEHRNTWFLAGHQTLTDTLDLKADAFYSKRDQVNHVATSTAVFTINNANPYFVAPAGTGATSETVGYQFTREYGNTRPSEVDLGAYGINLELQWAFAKDWQARLSTNYGKSTAYARTPAVDGNALTAALASTDPATAFDPFNGHTSAATLSTIGGGGVSYTADQDLKEGQLNVDGPLFDLPGGPLRVAVGAQVRSEGLSGVPYSLVNSAVVSIPGGPQSASRRDIAEYVEFNVPVVGSGNALPGVNRLVLSLAGRHDDYSDFGSTSNPKISLDYQPIKSVTIRGSVSSSFQAPSLADMKSVDTRLQTQPSAGFRPAGANPNVPEIFLAGGTPTLQPQTAHTYTYGVDFSPANSGFGAGASYWHSNIKKQIGLAFPTQVPLFTNPYFSTFWWGPGGQPLTQAVLNSFLAQYRVDAANAAFTPAYQAALIAGGYILDLRRKNLGETTLDGIDFNMHYSWKADLGDFTASVAGTRELHRKNIPAPGLAQVNLSLTDPQIQGRASIDWSRGQWSGGVNYNFVGAYNVTGTDVGTYRARQYASVDVRATYRLGEDAGILKNLDVTVQANNLFNADPPFVLAANGYSAAHSNQIGQLLMLSLVKRW